MERHTRGAFLATIGKGTRGMAGLSALGGIFTAMDDTVVGASASTLNVGLLTSITGVFQGFGVFMSGGAHVAVDEINRRGGILGRPINLIIADDQSGGAAGATQARRLLFQDNVDVLIGTVNSDTTLSVLPLVKQAGKTFIYPVDGDDRTCTPNHHTNPLAFGLGDTPFQRQGRFISYAVQHFGKDWYLLGNDYVFPHSELAVTKQYLKQAGGTVVAEEYTPLGTTDYLPIVRRIQGSKAQVVFAVVPGTDGDAFIKASRESGLFQHKTITGVATFAAEVYPGMAGFANGVITVDRYTELIDNPVNKRFVRAYKKRFHPRYPIGPSAALTYSAFLILEAAAKKARSLDGPKMRKAMEGLSILLPIGPAQVGADHLLKQHEYVLRIENNQYHIVKDLGLTTSPDHNGCTVKSL
jgi:ABC-type branched-subunit amino acid transport system substrate-binding protein